MSIVLEDDFQPKRRVPMRLCVDCPNTTGSMIHPDAYLRTTAMRWLYDPLPSHYVALSTFFASIQFALEDIIDVIFMDS